MKMTTILSLLVVAVLGSFGYMYYTDHHVPDRERRQAFLHAIETGNISDARRHLDDGVDVNTENQRGQTALQIAAAKGNKPMVDLLLASGGKGLTANPARPTVSHSPRRVIRGKPT